MPKETFFNLPEEKRRKIIETATREFAVKGYQGCSIQTIADESDVAKGSMYQYFENKKELFFYILDLAGQKKAEVIAEIMKDKSNLPFFELLEVMFIAGIRFAVQHPELYRIYQDIQEKAPEEIRKEFNDRTNALGLQYYHSFLSAAANRNEIRNDLSMDLMVYVFCTFARSFGDYLVENKSLDSEEKYVNHIRQFLEILKNGIKPHEGD